MLKAKGNCLKLVLQKLVIYGIMIAEFNRIYFTLLHLSLESVTQIK